MASFWLKYIAHETISAALVLCIAQMEAPENWHLSWVSRHGLDEGPDHHQEYYMEKSQQNYDVRIIY